MKTHLFLLETFRGSLGGERGMVFCGYPSWAAFRGAQFPLRQWKKSSSGRKDCPMEAIEGEVVVYLMPAPISQRGKLTYPRSLG